MIDCPACQTSKDRTDFYDSPTIKRGYRVPCKDCIYRRSKGYAKSPNRNKTPAAKARKKRWSDAHKKERRVWEREYRQRPEVKARRRAFIEANPEYVRSYVNARRGRKAASPGGHTSAAWLELCELYGFRCLDCDRTDRPLTRDHIVPLSKGGTDLIENIQPLCKPCNSKKGSKIIDFRPRLIKDERTILDTDKMSLTSIDE